MKFNINNNVRIRLTPKGRKIWAHRYDELNKYYVETVFKPEYPKEVDGWFEEQLWVIMNVFGPHLYNGGALLFETEIEIPEDGKDA